MQKRKLGNSDLILTTIGLGTWAMGGGDWKFGWGPQDDKQSIYSIHKALDIGINWIDTAPIYGHGHAERVVGTAIADRRDSLIIATKCGRVWDEGSIEIGKSLRAASIRKEVEDSLRRLKIDVIDLYQIHWPQPDEQIEEGWEAMAGLVQEGKVRYIGVSNFSLAQLERIQDIHAITSLQPPYSMLKRDMEDVIVNYCGPNKIGVIAYSPMQAGLLTGKFDKNRVKNLPASDWRSRNPFFTEPELSINLKTVDQLQKVADEKGISLAQLSLAWVMRLPEMTAAIVGARRPEQIEETAKASDINLSTEEIGIIEAILANRQKALEIETNTGT